MYNYIIDINRPNIGKIKLCDKYVNVKNDKYVIFDI